MATTHDFSALYSTVRNTSGGKMKFGFLPPHGRELADGEEFTIWGNVLDAVSHFDRITDRRKQEALINAIDRGDLTIVHTPSQILEDVATGAIKQIQLGNGSLSAVDPSWTETRSASDSQPYIPA
jgi:hypothetical protein